MNQNKNKSLITQLRDATRSAVALPPIGHEALDVLDGYFLQCLALNQRLISGEKLTGWKVAFSGAAAQKRFGLNEPVFGALTDVMRVEAQGSVDLALLIQPKLEVELAFVVGHSLIPGDYSDDEILAAIAEVAPAFEIADCRWEGWSFGAGAFLADNAAAGFYCMGQIQKFDPVQHASVSYRLECEGMICGAGDTDEREDAPLVNLCWLIRRLLADGHPLEAGHVILSGALLPPMNIQPAQYRLHMLGTELALGFKAPSGAT
ncbi:MAG TPA: 2-keto-4-pentenoate hydratase [Pseudomonas sp.]|nr:2-keto-4-pentenoate hydratase [Pseudomonas sp.]